MLVYPPEPCPSIVTLNPDIWNVVGDGGGKEEEWSWELEWSDGSGNGMAGLIWNRKCVQICMYSPLFHSVLSR